MKITRSNYESFLIDYLENNLNSREKLEMELFLQNNPDIEEEMAELSNFQLQAEEISYDSKILLKKSEMLNKEGNLFEENCIAYYENDLSLKEKNELLKLIEKDSLLKQEFLLYEKLKLNPDFSINYPNKNGLYHGKKIGLRTRLQYLSAAASIAVLFAIGFSMFSKNNSFTSGNRFRSAQNIALMQEKNIPLKKSNVLIKIEMPELKKMSMPLEEKRISSKEGNQLAYQEKLQTSNSIAAYDKTITKADARINIKPIQTSAKELKEVVLAKNNMQESQPDIPLNYANAVNLHEYQTIPEFLKESVKEKIAALPVKKRKFDAFTLLKTGLTGIGKLTESEVNLEKEFNDKGELVAYVYTSNLISFRKVVKK